MGDDATITTTDNGPYLVQGGIIVLDADGNRYRVSGTAALCRCGLSGTKPFCDGTHEKASFAAVDRAAAASLRVRSPAAAAASR